MHVLPAGTPPALDLRGICKAFDGKPALDDAHFSLAWGEVHALVGENGAGKSTLMNVATGVYAADHGSQIVDGSELSPRSPQEATDAGIGMVHQHFRLVDRFSVAENVLLTLGGRVRSLRAAADLIAAKAREVGLDVDPFRQVSTLSIAERQRVEILKVLLLGARIIILDEPTAVLTEEESSALLVFTRRLADADHAVVLITHKLKEVAAHTDRITVMRHGKTVLAGAPMAEVSEAEVGRLIVGEAVVAAARPQSRPGEERLVVRGLGFDGQKRGGAVELTLRAGEVLGLAGVGGNGQEQLVACLAGTLAASAGSFTLSGVDVTRATPSRRRDLGLRVIPASRFATGLVRQMSIAENLAMTNVRTGHFGGRWFLDRRRMKAAALAAIERFDIRGAGPNRRTELLSGGNAQKVLLARELDDGLKVLIAHSPSRGLDVKASEFVRDAIRAAVEAGAACLLISEDLQEVMGLSHRVAVMNGGVIAGNRPIADVTPEWIGALLTGHA
ncbi:ABC transporter ATP-binding protein [Oryzibacter oryziterrae]|uniref:ABC transporter ATP-binding protein n=1 Tax=Oryzibacter oryziterrae TaxID=2766474 RepID=UPI001F22BAD7|nr:ABC transporter ATP-binding protein [Oryzibacter oryziterrae]